MKTLRIIVDGKLDNSNNYCNYNWPAFVTDDLIYDNDGNFTARFISYDSKNGIVQLSSNSLGKIGNDSFETDGKISRDMFDRLCCREKKAIDGLLSIQAQTPTDSWANQIATQYLYEIDSIDDQPNQPAETIAKPIIPLDTLSHNGQADGEFICYDTVDSIVSSTCVRNINLNIGGHDEYERI